MLFSFCVRLGEQHELHMVYSRSLAEKFPKERHGSLVPCLTKYLDRLFAHHYLGMRARDPD